MANTLKPWRTRQRRSLLSSGPVLDVAVETVELPDGRVVPDYHVVRLPDYVLVFAEPTAGWVIMLRQYKHGPRRVCLTFPGGALDTDESPLDAAQRELLEETGYQAEEWLSLGTFVTNANQGCNRVHLFRASACQHVREACAGDLEEISLELIEVGSLLNSDHLTQIGLVSHVALLLLATRFAVTPQATRE